jgi:hypothetical protein
MSWIGPFGRIKRVFLSVILQIRTNHRGYRIWRGFPVVILLVCQRRVDNTVTNIRLVLSGYLGWRQMYESSKWRLMKSLRGRPVMRTRTQDDCS